MGFKELYEEYVVERTGCRLLILDDSYMVFKVDGIDGYGRVIYVEDFFVSSKGRKSEKHSAVKMLAKLKEAAKEIGDIKEIRAKVELNTITGTESLKANLYYGFEAVGAHDDRVFVRLKLDNISSGGPMRGKQDKGEKDGKSNRDGETA